MFESMPSPLLQAVRRRSGVVGSKTEFQRILPDKSHTPVECELLDYFSGEWLPSVQSLVDDPQSMINSACEAAYHLLRKSNELIKYEFESRAGLQVGDYKKLDTTTVVLDALNILGARSIPDDGRRFGLVPSDHWLDIANKAEACGVPFDCKNQPVKWLGVWWFMDNDLFESEDKTGVNGFVFHTSSVGFAYGNKVSSSTGCDIYKDKVFLSACLPMGATIIDPTGVVKLKLKKGN